MAVSIVHIPQSLKDSSGSSNVLLPVNDIMEETCLPQSVHSSEPQYLTDFQRDIPGEIAATSTPWITRKYTCGTAGLHDEICDFYEYIKPRPSEIQMQNHVILQTQNIINKRWPKAKVHVFGSYITGLFLPTGDVDLVVECEANLPLFSLVEDLKNSGIALEDNILILDKSSP